MSFFSFNIVFTSLNVLSLKNPTLYLLLSIFLIQKSSINGSMLGIKLKTLICMILVMAVILSLAICFISTSNQYISYLWGFKLLSTWELSKRCKTESTRKCEMKWPTTVCFFYASNHITVASGRQLGRRKKLKFVSDRIFYQKKSIWMLWDRGFKSVSHNVFAHLTVSKNFLNQHID